MALTEKYDSDFERLWALYPTNWPKGRSKKHLAAKAFDKAKKLLGMTPEDIDELAEKIETAKLTRASWQYGHQYGPQGMQTWIHQRGWLDDFETVKDTRPKPDRYQNADVAAAESRKPLTDEQRAASQAAYQRAMAELKNGGPHATH